jgi:hypothetical protein
MSGLDKLRGFVDEHNHYNVYLLDEEIQALVEGVLPDVDDSTYEGAILAGMIGQLMMQFTSLNVNTEHVYSYVYDSDDGLDEEL